MPTRPKTGQKRITRQPFKIDRLPMEMRERIQRERASGLTWQEIEDLSPQLGEWEKVPAEVQAKFPGRKLPVSTLQRWYDVRVEQIKKEVLEEAAKAREFATAFAGPTNKDLPDAVRNALGDQIFALMQSADATDKKQFRRELLNLGILLAEHRKLDIQERKQQTNERALEFKIQQMQEKVQVLKEEVADKKKELTPEELQKKLDEIYGLGQA